jgi:release factor glutamine methyltransferase
MAGTAGVLRAVAAELARAGVDTPEVDAELLVAHALGLSRSAVRLAADRVVTTDAQAALDELVSRRARREPLQYVLGEWGFRRLVLRVDARALIPRPETEIVVERALALIADLDAPAVLDVGVGSGAIALAIADERPEARVLGIDTSEAALELARENAERCRLDVELVRHDLFAGLPPGPWDAIVSNPPYVPRGDRDNLAPEVRDWEPAAALFDNGATARLIGSALPALARGGALVVEVGDGQARDVAAALEASGSADVNVVSDLAGRERVVEGRRAGA